jgi:cell wall-associated NlpC family hydrolase
MRKLLWIAGLGLMLTLPVQGQNPGAKDPEPGQLSILVERAKTLVGLPYRFGGTTPRGFDCSGFVKFVFNSVGIDLDRDSRSQSRQGDKVSLDDLKPGDLLFFATRGVRRGISHVGIYLGEGQFIHASSWNGPGMHCVKMGEITSEYFAKRLVTARRVLTGESDPAPGPATLPKP